MAAKDDAAAAAAAPPPPLMGSVRLTQVLLLFTGLLLTYTMRAVISVAILPIGDRYDYNSIQRGWVHSSFFWGYITTNILGGAASSRYGGWVLLLVGVSCSAVGTLACVSAAQSMPTLLLCRAFVGAAQGLIYPSCHSVVSKWAPKPERATLVGTVWSGGFLGPAVTLPLAGALVSGNVYVPGLGKLATAWPSVFWLAGAASLGWCAAWYALGASTPASHGRISPEERAYIVDSIGAGGKPVGFGAVPWRRVLTHPAALAIVVVHATHNYQLYLLLAWLPAYLKDMVGYDLHNAGGVAVAPYLACFFASLAAGALGDHATRVGWPVATVRKIAMTASEVVPAAALMAATYVTSPGAAVACLTVAVGLSGACTAGFASNHMDIVPQYAGLLLGLSNTIATLPGIAAPVIVGALVNPPHNDMPHWRAAFGLSAGISVLGWAVYVALARGTRQPELDVVADEAADGGAGAAATAPGAELRGGGGDDDGGEDGGGGDCSPPESPVLRHHASGATATGVLLRLHAHAAASSSSLSLSADSSADAGHSDASEDRRLLAR